MSSPGTQQYYRTDSSESAARMLRSEGGESGSEPEGKGRVRRECSPLWLAVAGAFIVALQIACTTGLFVYFSMSISKLKAQTQGMSDELRCLQIINRMEDVSDPVEFDLDGLILNEACQKLASNIKSYITQVTESVIQRTATREARRTLVNSSDTQPFKGVYTKSSAHVTLRLKSPSGGTAQSDGNFGITSQSCRYLISQWQSKNSLSHVQNMSYQDGRLKILQDGKYYVYSQIYFRYTQRQEPSTSPPTSQQLVQCINKKTAYDKPILLLKGVGTKCWAPNAEHGLHSIYQGALFELRSGDELFISVSSLDMVDADITSSYFGAFRLDM